MPIDASIYSQIKPVQQSNPLEEYGRLMQLKSLGEQTQLQSLQRKKLTGDLEEEEAFKKGLAGLAPGAKLEEALPGLYATSPTRAMSLEKSLTEQRKAKGEADKVQAELVTKAMVNHRDALSGVNTPEQAAQWVAAGFQNPLTGSVAKQYGTLEQALANIPTDPAQFEQWKQKNGLGMTKFIELNKPHFANLDTGGEQLMTSTPGLGGQTQVVARATKTMTPGEVASNNRAREQMERGDWQYDSDRGLMVNKRTGASRQVTAQDGNPVGPSPTNLLHQSELEAKETSRQGALQSYDTAMGTLERLMKHGGFEDAVGVSLSKAVSPFWSMPATQRKDFEKEFESFKSQTFLPMVQQLRGMGALSNAEGDKLTAAVGALDTGMSEKAFKESGGRILADLKAAKERFERQGPVPGTKPSQQGTAQPSADILSEAEKIIRASRGSKP